MTDTIQAPYFIELLTRDHQVKSRQQFAQFPIRIGRAYDNDYIIDDPYVSPQHAVIEMLDGETSPIIRDLGSENGVLFNGQRKQSMALDAGDFTLGHTLLRFRYANYPVQATIQQVNNKQWESWPAALLGLLLITCSSLISTWLASTEQFSPLKATLDIGTALMVMLMWCGGWALATRIMNGHISKFGRHVFIAACAIICIDIWNILSTTTAYAFSLPLLTRYGSHVIAAIAAMMIFFHLDTINPKQKKRFTVISCSIAILISGFMLINNYQRHGYVADRLYMKHLLSPSLRISKDHPTTTFIQNAKALQEKVDQARQEKIAETNGGH